MVTVATLGFSDTPLVIFVVMIMEKDSGSSSTLSFRIGMCMDRILSSVESTIVSLNGKKSSFSVVNGFKQFGIIQKQAHNTGTDQIPEAFRAIVAMVITIGMSLLPLMSKNTDTDPSLSKTEYDVGLNPTVTLPS